MTDDVRGESTGPKPLPSWIPRKDQPALSVKEPTIDQAASDRAVLEKYALDWVMAHTHPRTEKDDLYELADGIASLVEAHMRKYRRRFP